MDNINDSLEKYFSVFQNQKVSLFCLVLFILYILFIMPVLSNKYNYIFNNIIFQLVILLFIFFVAKINCPLAIIITIAFILTLINNKKTVLIKQEKNKTVDHFDNSENNNINDFIENSSDNISQNETCNSNSISNSIQNINGFDSNALYSSL